MTRFTVLVTKGAMDAARIRITLPFGAVSLLEWRPQRSPSGIDVLLLHGGGTDSASLSWGVIGPAIAEAGHRVLAPDHPGFGESFLAPWAASQERLVGYVGALVDALGLDRYAVGGLSMGGGMAIGHALERPHAVRGLMLLGSYGIMLRQFDGPLGGPLTRLTGILARSGALAAVTRSSGRSRRLMAAGLRGLIRRPGAIDASLLDEAMAEASRPEAGVAFGQWQRDELAGSTLRSCYLDRLGEITCPALIVHGTRDAGVPIARAREAAARIPRAELLEIEGAGHWVQRDRPELVAPRMTAFLAALERDGA